MDYAAMAEEFMRRVPVLMRTHTQQKIGEFAKGEMFILNYLAMQGREILPSELSAVMGASSARIAAALNSLEHKGKIVRRMDEGAGGGGSPCNPKQTAAYLYASWGRGHKGISAHHQSHYQYFRK